MKSSTTTVLTAVPTICAMGSDNVNNGHIEYFSFEAEKKKGLKGRSTSCPKLQATNIYTLSRPTIEGFAEKQLKTHLSKDTWSINT